MKRLLQLSLLLLSSSTLSAQWAIIHEDATEEFGAAHFRSADTGFVASSYTGTIFRTYNGGTTWTPHETPFMSSDIQSIMFPSTEIGYAGGANMTFMPRQMAMKTTDGGNTWDTLHVSDTTPYINFRRVEFANNNYGMFLSNEIYITNDGATTFSLMPKPKDDAGTELLYSYFYDATMLMPDHFVTSCVWYESDEATPEHDVMGIFTTTDGGATWTERYRDSLAIFNLYFANHDHGWATTGSNVLHTTDAGATWMKHPLPPLGAGGFIGKLLFIDEENGWISINQYTGTTQSGQLYKTGDGGATWALELSIPDRMITSFDMITEEKGYITTPNRIYKKSEEPSSTKPQLIDENKINVYPNPAKDKIEIDHDVQTRVTAIKLVDIAGRIVKSFDAQTATLSIAGVASGNYLLQITTEEGIVVKKLAIE